MHRESQTGADDNLGRSPENVEVSIEITARRVIRILLVVVISLILVGLSTQLYVEMVENPSFRGLANRFDLDEEVTVPTWYATSTLLICSALLAVIASVVRQQGGRYFKSWVGLAVIFLLASIDEGSGFHELSMRGVRRAFDLPSYFYFAWVIPGFIIVITFVAVYLKFWLHLPARTRWLFAAAATLFVSGSIGFEIAGGHITALRGQHNLPFQLVATIEESLEMFGILVFIGALLDYLARITGRVRVSFRSTATVAVRGERYTDRSSLSRAAWLARAWLLTVVRAVVVVTGCILISLVIIPAYLNGWESFVGTAVSTESAIRWYLAAIIGLSLAASWAWRWRSWAAGMRHTWIAYAVMLLVFLVICALDPALLRDEESWIRYPTAGALVVAGVAALWLCAASVRAIAVRGAGEIVFWAFIGIAFLLAATDELLELHENIAVLAERAGVIAGIDQDWITLAYGGIALVAMVLFWLGFGRRLFASFPWVVGGYLAAAGVFVLSQAGDSMDEATLASLRSLASTLVEQAHQFPDIWFVLFRPEDLLNATEEVLELTAAVLLMTVSLRMLATRLGSQAESMAQPVAPSTGIRLAPVVFGIGVIGLAMFSWPAAMATVLYWPKDAQALAAYEGPTVSVDVQGTAFREAVWFASGASITIESSAREVALRNADGSVAERFRLRRMLTDLKGVARDGYGELYLLTDDDDGKSFLPAMRWKTGFAVRSENGVLSMSPATQTRGITAEVGPGRTSGVTRDTDVVQSAINTLIREHETERISRDQFVSSVTKLQSLIPSGPLRGELQGALVLGKRARPYEVDDLVVAENAALVLTPGVELRLARGATLRVLGRLYALGTPAEPVKLHGPAQGHYSQVVLSGIRHLLRHVSFSKGATLLSVVDTGTHPVLIENSTFDHWRRVALNFRGADGLVVSGSRFGTNTRIGDIQGETVHGETSAARLENNIFGLRRGYADVMDLGPCADGHFPIIKQNRFLGGEDDAIDLDDCTALVVGNYIANFVPTWESRPDGANGGAITGSGASRPLIANNVIVHSFHGIGFKDGAEPFIVHNTIAACNIGITLYASRDDRPAARAFMFNNILWNNRDWQTMAPQDVLLNGAWWYEYSPVQRGDIDARHNIVGSPLPGVNNLVIDPNLKWVDGIPELAPGSPARDSALRNLPDVSAFTPAQLRQVLSTDYLQRDRPIGVASGASDQGAVEAR